MDNLAIARVLAEIGDLLEIKGENPFKIRAYRNASETASHLAERLADLTPAQRLAIPGIGKDLAAKIGTLIDTGAIPYHQELLQEFPATILDLLHLQGVGPKTAALLYRELNIRTLDDLEAAITQGRLRGLKGVGEKKAAQILRAIGERAQVAGRRLMAEATDTAEPLLAALRAHAPDGDITVVGSLRRGCETTGDLDIVAGGAPPSLIEAFTGYDQVERVLAHGATKSSVLLRGGFQADLRLVARESLGAARQYFTGSKAHNIALRDRALQRGFKLNEYGLYRLEDDTAVAGADEDGIYRALGLAPIPAELRENRGEIEAAERDALPVLVAPADLRGDLHMHTTATDGRADIETMARAARDLGHQYIAITDHSQALAMANGLDERAALAHAARIREVNDRLDGITVLAGIECDIRADGTMDLADDCLAELDVVVASVHSAFTQEPAQMTDRILRALECPWVDILAHPTGRLLLRREGYHYDMERVFAAAAERGVAIEINSQVDRLDLRDTQARLARDRGVRLIIDSDAHSPAALRNQRWGVAVARRAWLTASDVLNTRPLDELLSLLRRRRSASSL
ncbi:MAG: DNA polymerase/3'-5' exonuclease PolX [Vicinamibacterales bacterium]